MFEKCGSYFNSTSKYSEFFSYYFGRSDIFSMHNIHYMKKFYCCFPVFCDRFRELSFEHYKLIVDVSDLKRRYFYFWLALFCRSNVCELEKYIQEDLYARI